MFNQGFYLDAPEHKKRRYCLICHIFKPERCHHCSSCNRCVLNMDHHCPWINNCIGFYNRKFFILLLFYVLLTILFVICGLSYEVFTILKQLFTSDNKLAALTSSNIMILAVFITQCILLVMKGIFFKFHVWLITQNMTTIENMNKERSGYNPLVWLFVNLDDFYSLIWVPITTGFKFSGLRSCFGLSQFSLILGNQLATEQYGQQSKSNFHPTYQNLIFPKVRLSKMKTARSR